MADQVIQEIKDRLDIVEVIGSYLQLKRAGVNWRANCPFHNEKTPSFNVNPTRQIWHCFGCGEGGDVFSFVQKYERLEFPDTLKLLADRAGVQLPERRPEDAKVKDFRDRLYRVNAFAAKYYHQILLSSAGRSALEYLQGRGLTEETLNLWEIGYAPDEYQALEKALLGKGAKKDDMVAAGVSARSARGTYDRFRGRITFPIFEFSGKIVGFSARILAGDQAAKYINSPESPVYSKGHVLFGLYQAKNAIREQDYAVVVEGQMDCIKAHQAGFANTVATSGTALTAEQLRLLGRFTKNLKLCFDADTAGRRAAKKAGTLALSMGFSVKLITVIGAKDPDELISTNPKLWEDALKNSVWFIEYFIRQAEQGYAPRSVEQRKFVAQEIIPLMSLLPDPLEQDHYVLELTERFGFGQSAVLELLRKYKQTPVAAQAESPEKNFDSQEAFQAEPALPVSPAEKHILGILLFEPRAREEWLGIGGGPIDFTNPQAQELVRLLLQQGLAVVAQEPLAKEAVFVVESEKTSFDGSEAAFLLELYKSIYIFRLTALKNRQQQVTASMRLAEGNKNNPALYDLQREFAELTTARLNLERKIQSI